MLQDSKAFSGFSVDDLAKAKDFYKETLGLNVEEYDMTMQMLSLHLNGVELMIYPKPDHAPASYTVLNFGVNDVDKKVEELAAKGIKFEQYDNEWIKTEPSGIARGNGNGPDIAWFKDPAGNILSVLTDPK